MRVVVVGTGTDIGKTHVSGCILAFARSRGLAALGYKPVATGVDGTCEDARVHAMAAGRDYVPPTYAYRRPVSPLGAAREDERPISLPAIALFADQLGQGQDLLLVETAGGLFTPLSASLTNADLVKRLLPARVLLVAPDRLGVLSDVQAYALAAKAVRVELAAVVLSAPASADASTGSNAAELEAIGVGPVAGVFPRAPFDARESLDTAAHVWDALAPSSA